MAKRKPRRQTRRSPRDEDHYPGWAWGLFGLAVGLSVAAAIWVNDRRPGSPEADRPQPASLESAIDDIAATEAAAAPDADAFAEDAAEPAEKRFTFYDMLPNFEVIVPEEDNEVIADTTPKAVVEPGIYVLQAGSFTSHADADRRRAQLALQGIESTIQRVMIDEKTYHRVRIGPTDDLDELNLLRSRLRAADIDALRIRLGD